MSASRVPVGRLAAGLALVVGAWAVAHSVGGPHWRELAPGVEFATLRGEPFCRAGSSTVALLRLDPARVRLRVLHYTRLHSKLPLTSAGWLEYTSAIAVFNAGQYYPDYGYMGLLVSGGKVVSGTEHPSFRAALVAEPLDTGRTSARARVLDLERERIDLRRPRWREVAQSFMLFDTSGTPRVRRTDQVANRTVIAEDDRGRIVVVTSEGAYTLWDFARLLKTAPLGLRHAMAMDGGHEAQLCVRTGSFRYASFGRWPSGDEQPQEADAQTPLPAVVAVVPR